MLTHRFEVETPARLDVLVAEAVEEVSRSRAARLVRGGAVTVDGKVVTRPSHTPEAGSQLEIHVPEPEPTDVIAQDLPVSIVFEDDQLAVIDKAPGMVVHPSPGHASGTLVNALLHHLDGLSGVGGELRPGIVHRLDRGTSGLMVVAKHDQAHRHLAAQFADHSAGRRYLAVCIGRPKEERGTITSYLGRHPKDRLRMASVPSSRGRRAVTHWRVRTRAGSLTLVECRLETGRTHQVRVHLTEQGWPIAGDGLYAPKGQARLPASVRGLVDPSGQRPLLHAWRLDLTHPATEERRVFRAAPPPDYSAVLDALGVDFTDAD